MAYFTTKNFNNFKGLDLRSSDLTRSSEYASDSRNVKQRRNRSLAKRYGYKPLEEVAKHYGMVSHTILDNNNCFNNELISLSENGILVLQEDFLDITYTNPNAPSLTVSTMSVKYYPEEQVFRMILKDDFVEVFNQVLGKGRDELTTYTVQNLIDDINLTANFSATLRDSNTAVLNSPAALIQEIYSIGAGDTETYSLDVKTWSEITAAENNQPFAAYCSNIDDPNQQLPSFTSARDSLYIAVCDQELYKYDGTNLYRAGLPNPLNAPLNPVITPIGITDSNFWVGYTYVYTDALGNETESMMSPLFGDIALTDETLTLDVDNVLSGQGFDSANIKIRIYTTDDSPAPGSGGPGTLYFQKEVNNDPNSPTQSVVIDTEPLQVVGSFEYIQPDEAFEPPPRTRYLTTHRGQIIAVPCDDCNVVAYSDNIDIEKFPVSKSFIVEGADGAPITAVSTLENILVTFTSKSIHATTGTLFDFKFRTDVITNGHIGCISHSTVQDIAGTLFFLDQKGVFAVSTSSGEPAEVSDLISPYFDNTPFNLDFAFNRATAVNWVQEDSYVLFMPILETDQFSTTTQLYASDRSLCFVFDYFNSAWNIWDNINALQGMEVHNDKLFYTEQNTRNDGNAVRRGVFNTYMSKNYGDTTDYSDYDSAIDWMYATNWESAGEPSVYKKYLRLKVHALDDDINDFESPGYGLIVENNINYRSGAFYSRYELDFGKTQTGYGTDPWGEFPWGNSRPTHRVCKLRQNKCRSIRSVFKNNEFYRNVLISGYEYETDASYNIAMKE